MAKRIIYRDSGSGKILSKTQVDKLPSERVERERIGLPGNHPVKASHIKYKKEGFQNACNAIYVIVSDLTRNDYLGRGVSVVDANELKRKIMHLINNG